MLTQPSLAELGNIVNVLHQSIMGPILCPILKCSHSPRVSIISHKHAIDNYDNDNNDNNYDNDNNYNTDNDDNYDNNDKYDVNDKYDNNDINNNN